MLYFPFETASNSLYTSTNATKTEKDVLEIKPNPHLNRLTYSVSNRNMALMRR